AVPPPALTESSVYQSRSIASATPCPPPIHSVANPFLASRRAISESRVTNTRQTDAPMGCPRAIAPPLTLTFDTSHSSSLLTDRHWAAKASLASIRSSSAIDQPALLRHFLLAGTGPIPMIAGSTAALA